MKKNCVSIIINLLVLVFTVLQILINAKITSILLIISLFVYSLYLTWILYKNGQKILSVLTVILGILIISSDIVVLSLSSTERHQFALIIRLAGYILLNVITFFTEDKNGAGDG